MATATFLTVARFPFNLQTASDCTTCRQSGKVVQVLRLLQLRRRLSNAEQVVVVAVVQVVVAVVVVVAELVQVLAELLLLVVLVV